MKKIISILIGSFFFASTAYAGGMIGLKAGVGDLEGNKKSYTAGSTNYAAQSKSENSEYGAIFAEIEIPTIAGLSLGVEYIPFTATVSVDGNSSDSHLELSDHTTLYGLMMLPNDVAYIKAGYAMADIGNVKANYDTTTINTKDSTLEGPMVGVGFQKDLASDFVGRAEATYTKYDDVSVRTTSNGSTSVKKTADAELITLSLSISKQF